MRVQCSIEGTLAVHPLWIVARFLLLNAQADSRSFRVAPQNFTMRLPSQQPHDYLRNDDRQARAFDVSPVFFCCNFVFCMAVVNYFLCTVLVPVACWAEIFLWWSN